MLLVDDEPGLVRAYRRILISAGYDVEVAHDGTSAVGLFQQHKIDAVLTDITMPGMDGVALLRSIRRCDPDVPVVLATGGPSVETAIEAMDHGALKYLVKPIDPDALLGVIERAVQLSRLAETKRQALELLRESQVSVISRRALSDTFERALDELFLDYQPIVCWSERRVYGYEALVRSHEPKLPHPGALFEAAEQLSKVLELGQRIRSHAARTQVTDNWSLFINLHPEDLADDELLDPRSPLLAMASRVVLELTERQSITQIADVRSRIAALRSAGYRIAVDDLGAGYAGLSSFAILEPDVAKLDMGLVRDVDKLPMKQRLIRSLSDVCRDMKMPLVAEGVETVAERDVLIDLGCDLFQGYLFARPCSTLPTVRW